MSNFTITIFPNGVALQEFSYDDELDEYMRGSKHWWLNHLSHREDGPAIEYSNGDKEWYLNGKKHRENGPAIDLFDGTKEWWLNDKHVSKKEFEQLMRLKGFW
jgi:hypothetical protein